MSVEQNTSAYKDYTVIRPWQLDNSSQVQLTNKCGKVYHFSAQRYDKHVLINGGKHILRGYPYGGMRVGQALHLFEGSHERPIIIETIQKIRALGILEDTFTPYIKLLADQITALKEFESVIDPVREYFKLKSYATFETEHARLRFQVDEVIYALYRSLKHEGELPLSPPVILQYLKQFAEYIEGTARFHPEKVIKKHVKGHTTESRFAVDLCYFPDGDISHVYVEEWEKLGYQINMLFPRLQALIHRLTS